MLDRLLAFALVVGLLLAVGAALKDEAVEGDACAPACEAPASPPRLHEEEARTPAPLAAAPPPLRHEDDEEKDEREEEREERREKRKGGKGKGKRDD